VVTLFHRRPHLQTQPSGIPGSHHGPRSCADAIRSTTRRKVTRRQKLLLQHDPLPVQKQTMMLLCRTRWKSTHAWSTLQIGSGCSKISQAALLNLLLLLLIIIIITMKQLKKRYGWRDREVPGWINQQICLSFSNGSSRHLTVRVRSLLVHLRERNRQRTFHAIRIDGSFGSSTTVCTSCEHELELLWARLWTSDKIR
jgi:hypothetical protein